MGIQREYLLLVTHLINRNINNGQNQPYNCKTMGMFLLHFSSKSPSACPLLPILMPQHLTSHVSDTEADLADSLALPKWFHINRWNYHPSWQCHFRTGQRFHTEKEHIYSAKEKHKTLLAHPLKSHTHAILLVFFMTTSKTQKMPLNTRPLLSSSNDSFINKAVLNMPSKIKITFIQWNVGMYELH